MSWGKCEKWGQKMVKMGYFAGVVRRIAPYHVYRKRSVENEKGCDIFHVFIYLLRPVYAVEKICGAKKLISKNRYFFCPKLRTFCFQDVT